MFPLQGIAPSELIIVHTPTQTETARKEISHMAAKAQRINIRGIAVFPALNTPDKKFVDEGQYKADVRVPLEEAQPIIDQLKEAFKAHTGKALKGNGENLYSLEEDDNGDRTGNVIFKCKVKNRITKAGKLWDRRPQMFDATGKLIDVQVWGGTEYIVGAEVYCWTAGDKKGVSLQPVAVQIINLVGPSGGTDASEFGFGEVEGGYVGEEASSVAFDDAEDVPDEDEDNFDF
jgi:hypothetical protein